MEWSPNKVAAAYVQKQGVEEKYRSWNVEHCD
jgi:hypothetical protein